MKDQPFSAATPVVSVLVTVFNRESYLPETLLSILNSTYADFEVIVVDDCSTDDSLNVAKRFATQDKRIHVYSNEANIGDYRNRNKAASFAKGKYIKYLDADDVIYPHSLSIMVAALEKFPGAALALSWNTIDPQSPYPILFKPRELYISNYLGRSPLGVGPSASIIRRDCFNEVGGFSGAQFVGDTELWLKLGEKWPVVALPPSLVWWRQHPGQQIELEQKIPEVLNIRHEMELSILSATVNLSDSQKQEAGSYLRHLLARRLLALGLKRRQFATAWSLFRNSNLSWCQLIWGIRAPKRARRSPRPE